MPILTILANGCLTINNNYDQWLFNEQPTDQQMRNCNDTSYNEQ